MSLYDELVELAKVVQPFPLNMGRLVFENCPLDSQENMVQQYREVATFKNRYVKQHGEVW